MHLCPIGERNIFSFSYWHQSFHFTREIRNFNPHSLTQVDGVLGRCKHGEGTLGGHEGRPGFNALPKLDNASGIFREGAVVQRLANLHEPVAIPAVHLVAPGLTGRIKANRTRMWMMRTTLLAWGIWACPSFSSRRIVGMKSTITFTLLNL